MSDASSAGMAGGFLPGYGTTCRQDVLRGVMIPVMPGTAGRARPARVFKLSVARTYPHAEHVFDDGYHWSMMITRRLYRAALYPVIRPHQDL